MSEDKPYLNLNWPGDRDKVREVQEALVKRVRIAPLRKEPRFVAGVDAAFLEERVIAAACLYSFPELEPVEEAYSIKDLNFPYIPGFLSFREGPSVIDAIKRLNRAPDIVIFDGQGIAHPKGLGLASYVGALLDIPSIGCAKSRLVGTYAEPGQKKGCRRPLKQGGKTIGAVLRTKDNTRPVFVSPGHLVDIEDSVRIVLGCTRDHRVTEPVRCADLLASRFKKSFATL